MPCQTRHKIPIISRLLPALLPVAVAGFLFLGSCSVFTQAKAFDRFVHSRFTLRSARLLSVGNVDVSQKESYSQLDFQQMVTLGMQLLKGNLPAVMEIRVEGHNPAQEKASISGTDWILLVKKDTLATGTIDKPLTIPAGETLQFPVIARFNFGKLLASGSLQQILNTFLSDNKQQAYRTGIVFKIRPWYRSGKKTKKFPAFLTIRPKMP